MLVLQAVAAPSSPSTPTFMIGRLHGGRGAEKDRHCYETQKSPAGWRGFLSELTWLVTEQ